MPNSDHPATWGQYWRDVGSEAFTLWHKGEGMAVFAGTVFGSFLLAVFWGFGGLLLQWKPETTLYGSGTLFLVFVLLALIVAPYRVWSGERRAVIKFEEDRKPRIEIGEPQSYLVPWYAPEQGTRAMRHFFVPVKNISSGQIIACSVQDNGFTNVKGHAAPVRGRYMRLKRERDAQPSQHTFTRNFELRGKEDSVDIDICAMDEREGDSRVIMFYATTPTEQHGNAIIRSLFPHQLTLRVTAENLPAPVDKKFVIFVDGDELKMESADDD
ncbi:MAG: hypothetical protein HQ495_04175 [Alphaproteobacteria bacterium]|nr:hypothetical protein [Alphaproteobacteria bacterium]